MPRPLTFGRRDCVMDIPVSCLSLAIRKRTFRGRLAG